MNIQFHDVQEENGKFVFDISFDNDFKKLVAKALKRATVSDIVVKAFIISVLKKIKIEDLNVFVEELD
jgi:hypothetical protein